MADSGSRDLTKAEQSYVAQVGYQMRHVPTQRQHAILQTIRRALLSAQPTDTYSRIEREMGTPASYADRLLGRGSADDTDLSDAVPAKRSSSTAGLWIAICLVVIMAVIVAVVLATR